MNENTIKLAEQLNSALIHAERDNGDSFVKLRDGSPAWMTEVIHETHNKLGYTLTPNDTIYEFIDKAAGAFGDADEDQDESEVIAEIEPDIYTHDLTAWLHESPSHVAYITEVLEEFGGDFRDGFQLLAMAQKQQIDEVAYALLSVLDDFDMPEDDNDGDDPDAGNGDDGSAPTIEIEQERGTLPANAFELRAKALQGTVEIESYVNTPDRRVRFATPRLRPVKAGKVVQSA